MPVQECVGSGVRSGLSSGPILVMIYSYLSHDFTSDLLMNFQ